MAEQLHTEILSHLKSEDYRPKKPRGLAQDLNLTEENDYQAFRAALKELMHAGRVVLGGGGTIVLPGQSTAKDQFVGTYRHNKRGFGFVVPTDTSSHEDLFIPEGENAGALTGDKVVAKITNREHREGKVMYRGRIIEILERSQNKFVGSLVKQHNDWFVLPDGNMLTNRISVPDAGSRHVKPGTKVVVELTQFPTDTEAAVGVITDVLGQAGEKDVDLRAIIVQHNLPADFPEEVKEQARRALAQFDPDAERARRLDMTGEVIVTIDPPDAKDYDDAISLRRMDSGNWQLGVHIADVAHFVPVGTALDTEARARGNSVYFPGHVIPMLPEVLSNGVCSLQEGVARLCKSAFITYGPDFMPAGTKFANTVIKSRRRFRYIEAQAIIDALGPRTAHKRQEEADEAAEPQPAETKRVNRTTPVRDGSHVYYDPTAVIPHPDGDKKITDYEPDVLELLHDMNFVARRLQKRRREQGQIVLDLPDVELVLDETGKVVDAVPEDQSFTHTLIEMFMVEANEASARLLDSVGVPNLRRTHPEPDLSDAERLRQFVEVAGLRIPKNLDRKAIQKLLLEVKGKPEAHAINLAVLKSLTRAEYSPEPIGHYALASEAYCHFTSPIRRYADLTIHRLIDTYLRARADAGEGGGRNKKKIKEAFADAPTFDQLMDLGKHISFTERRGDDAERELRQVKILELLSKKHGEEYTGVVTGITNFGLFVQLTPYLIEGLIRYEKLMDDWWDVDVRSGFVRGQRTGRRIQIGDVVKAIVARTDVARRELDLSITKILGRGGKAGPVVDQPPREDGRPKKGQKNKAQKHQKPIKKSHHTRGGGPRNAQRGRRGRR